MQIQAWVEQDSIYKITNRYIQIHWLHTGVYTYIPIQRDTQIHTNTIHTDTDQGWVRFHLKNTYRYLLIYPVHANTNWSHLCLFHGTIDFDSISKRRSLQNHMLSILSSNAPCAMPGGRRRYKLYHDKKQQSDSDTLWDESVIGPNGFSRWYSSTSSSSRLCSRNGSTSRLSRIWRMSIARTLRGICRCFWGFKKYWQATM